MCISDGALRAKIDGELPAAELKQVQAHLAVCASCRAREEAIAGRAERVSALFFQLAPGSEPPPDAAAAYGRLRARRERAPERWPRLARLFPARLTPVWGLATALALAAVLAWPPARAVAQRLLGILRVQAVVAVPMERDFVAEGKGQMLSQIFAGSVVTTKEGKQLNVAGREEAARMAGFDPRLPEMRSDTPQFTVLTARAFHFTVDSGRLTALASALDRPDLPIPPGFNGAQVFVDAPAAVIARYGECPPERRGPPPPGAHYDTCLAVMEAPAPTVVTQPNFDLRAVAEFGLELTGMNPEQARTFSQAIDWSSTIAIPIPRSASSYETVAVNGANGVLVAGVPSGPHEKLPPGYALFWVKNGVMHSISGFGNPGLAVPLAESLR